MSIDTLIKAQGEHLNSLKRLLQNFKKDSLSRKTSIYFKKRLQQVEDFSNKFNDTHNKIICTDYDAKSSAYQEYTKLAAEFEDEYMDIYCTIAEEFERMFPTTQQADVNRNDSSLLVTAVAAEARVHMPTLPVPKFSGLSIDWPGFYDAFSRLIHANSRLNDIQKFHFLKESLPAGRDNDVRQIPLTADNYAVAWSILSKRYNNPRIVFSNNMNALYNLTGLTKEKSEDIRSMISTVNVCIAACERIEAPVNTGDYWLAHYVSTKLPKETHTAWEHHLGSNPSIPSFRDLEQFLIDRLITIDAIENRNCSLKNCSPHLDNSKRLHVHNTHAESGTPAPHCNHCGDQHILRRCQKFLSLDCYQRKEIVNKGKLCLNCLSKSHTVSRCTSTKSCLQCGQRHHTLLHFPTAAPTAQPMHIAAPAQSTTGAQTSPVMQNQATPNSKHGLQCLSATSSIKPRRGVLLATARIILSNPDNSLQATLNALIDQGSEATIISEHAVQCLHLKRRTTRASITGVGQSPGNRCKATVSFNIQAATNPQFTIHADPAYVLSSLTSFLPSQNFQPQPWPHIQGLLLADPMYYRSKRIDLIIGADLLAQIILPGTKIGSPNEPIAQNTQFGWILAGRLEAPNQTIQVRCNHASLEIEDLLKQFCEVESVPERSTPTKEDAWCESLFQKTHTRQANGRYLVRLPFKTRFDPSMTLGKSHQIALNRFLQLERRFQRDPEKWQRYKEGIQEYFDLNQVTPVVTSERSTIITISGQPHVSSCVLPHHAVIKEESLTTKQRIVFDASAKTSNGRALNDILCVGPTLQNDLSAIILNWRHYRFVFTADIQKMYRCIDVHPDDAQYQRILWRAADGVIKEYCLNTVTFGTASAPYTAIRVMHQIAEDTRQTCPMAENVLKDEMYVDDILSGGHTLEAADQKREQTSCALKSAGMELRKWSSNEAALLKSIPANHQCNQSLLNWDNCNTVKTLGLYWQPNKDCFKFKMIASLPKGNTKREILSSIARLFDPLGLISPIIISGKIILKEVTMAKRTAEDGSKTPLLWDDPVPTALANQWQEFLNNLSDIHMISIPRGLNFEPDIDDLELHAFCDGSSTAYAAAVYLRVKKSEESYSTSLIVAKTKISPTKPLTIPRTELSGAVLAIKLMKWVASTNRWTKTPIPMFYWTDATIVLHWINGDVNRWKTFVGNRIAYILNFSAPSQWSHVGTADNPADCATRGLTPSALSTFQLWWNGPSWLCNSRNNWPKTDLQPPVIEESLLESKSEKIIANAAEVSMSKVETSYIHRFSTYTRLMRTTAYILRFMGNAKPNTHRTIGSLKIEELDRALLRIVQIVQLETFAAEIKAVKKGKPLPSSSKLSSLTPFISDEILRVHGRLRHSNLSYNRKHPIILPSSHIFTDLVINHSHQLTLHGGAQLTLAHTRYQFWIINGKRNVLRVLRKCVTCFKVAPTVINQLMGDLPLHRIDPPNRPFVATGVDYTGAIELKAARLRGTSFYKGYIAIFICLATKAVHLEIVTGLTTEHFLQALNRFIGRRGPVKHMYSDNGTNFVGASKVIKSIGPPHMEFDLTEIGASLSTQYTEWHFTPPYSPNFGGLWESNVKSIKHHLKRVVGETRLTYEELSTVLVTIEACLNSRPLCPLSADPDDLGGLTPGHFLIGDSLIAPPHYRPPSASFREQFLNQQKMIHQFWKQWSRDWLSHLQTRPKWAQEKINLNLDDLVIVKDDRLPAAQWMLGRVIELHPGDDSLVRVVTLKTQQGQIKRSVSKLCRLPLPAY